MCEFISFKLQPTSEGIKVLFAHSLNSHSDIPEDGYEAEWTKDKETQEDQLTVRIPPDMPDAKAGILQDWVFKRWSTWDKFVAYAISILNWKYRSLDLRDTPITALPENLSVGGWLDLSNTAIAALPENLSVGGWLNLSNTAITALPENLSVGGWLNLSNTAIAALPENLRVEYDIYLIDCHNINKDNISANLIEKCEF